MTNGVPAHRACALSRASLVVVGGGRTIAVVLPVDDIDGVILVDREIVPDSIKNCVVDTVAVVLTDVDNDGVVVDKLTMPDT